MEDPKEFCKVVKLTLAIKIVELRIQIEISCGRETEMQRLLGEKPCIAC